MPTGSVKWYGGTARDGRPVKYGFIEPDGDGNDVFVHASALAAAGLTELSEGDRLEFDLQSNQARAGGLSATNLKRLN